MKLFFKKKQIEKLNVEIQKEKIQSDKITPLKPGTRHFYHNISPSIKSWNGFTFEVLEYSNRKWEVHYISQGFITVTNTWYPT